LTDFDGLPFLDRDAQDLPGKRARYRDGRFIGFEFKQRLLWLDYISDFDVDLQHIAGLDTFAQGWQFDFCSHGW
jgi:hypothetical protein